MCLVRRSNQGNWLSQILGFGAEPHFITFSAFHSVQSMNSLCHTTVWFNVPVKSKLQHPLPGNPPGIWIIRKFLFKSPPSPGRKAVQMLPPSEKLLDYCFNFSEASMMLLKLCMWLCKHCLLDNTPYMPRDSGHNFHISTSSQTLAMN